MHWLDWIIVAVPLLIVFGIAFYSKRYVRSVADFLAAGRVAGRYVIAVGDMSAALSVITVISLVESQYQSGLGITFWNNLLIPVTIFMSLTGFVLYRYRQTRSLSMGQFLEMRYNRAFRIVAAAMRTISEAMANTIGPAVAARFFIYMLGLPLSFTLWGIEFQTFYVAMLLLLFLALLLIWPGGRISLLVTDALQGLMSYPIFVILACFILSELSWHGDIAPVLINRVEGESFINPNDIHALRDFNLFALIVTITSRILNRGAWIGNDSSGSGKTPHEQKMAGILGAWRIGFSTLMMALVALFVITIMQGEKFSATARDIREELVARISHEVIEDPAVQKQAVTAVKALPRAYPEGLFSRKNNPDTAYFNAVRNTLDNDAEQKIVTAKNLDADQQADIRGQNKAVFQEFRTLYYQVMTPVILRKELPPGIFGVFLLLMAMLLLSTDDSRIFNAASTLVQDVVMPMRSKPFEKKEHLFWLRAMSIVVAGFFFVASLFLAQLDYITMFINITCALWQGAAGPIIIGGLYTRWGNTRGAFASLILGSGTAFGGFFCQRTWSSTIYPMLASNGYLDEVNAIFEFVTKLCSPLVVWEMSADKFPINSYEISFISMMIGIIAYVAGSFCGKIKLYNLDRLLHRGLYADNDTPPPAEKKSLISRLVGITPEYTKGDRIIAWSVFFYAIIWQFVIAFVGVAVWNAISPLSTEAWNWYFYITVAVAGMIVGIISTIWFMWGGIRDMVRLFIDLRNRVENPLDDGWVEGQVSLADLKNFSSVDDKKEETDSK